MCDETWGVPVEDDDETTDDPDDLYRPDVDPDDPDPDDMYI